MPAGDPRRGAEIRTGEGKVLGDTTTLADATIAERLKRQCEEREEA